MTAERLDGPEQRKIVSGCMAKDGVTLHREGCEFRVPAVAVPPRAFTASGEKRRVGIEIEFFGPAADEATDLVLGLFGGQLSALGPHRYKIATERYGDFIVELDSGYAHPEEWRGLVSPFLRSQKAVEQVAQTVCHTVGSMAGLWMPVEIVTPPVPFDALADLERLVVTLRSKGASGTDEGLIFAFGTQINVEVPEKTAAVIVSYLKAYLLLSPWLRSTIRPDPLRRLLPFINPFPPEYLAKVFDPGYAPDEATLVADYLDANHTRNRELDLLPLFADMGYDVPSAGGKKVKARPALHYRLPDTRFSDPEWGLLAEWNRWLFVERLAADPRALAALGEACRTAGGRVKNDAERLAVIDAWRAWQP